MEGPLATFVQPGTDALIRHAFKQVGAIRIRQMRVDLNEGCSMTPQLAVWERERQRDEEGGGLVTFVEGCYASYLYFFQSKRTYGDGKEGFVYNNADDYSNACNVTLIFWMMKFQFTRVSPTQQHLFPEAVSQLRARI